MLVAIGIGICLVLFVLVLIEGPLQLEIPHEENIF
jgi:hypothetical protein